jgi:predicted kinase
MLSFYEFIYEEFSKNDPVPEISRQKSKLGIILLGLPGAGKSTFIKDFILPRNSQFKSFSTDDVSLLYTKDPNKYHEKSSILNIEKLSKFITTGQNFIYDTTGAHERNIFRIVNEARKQKYTVIFIQLISDVETAKQRNLSRQRVVSDEYIDFVQSRQQQNMISYSKFLKPDNYYIVQQNPEYTFFKYHDGKMYKRDYDRYVEISAI